jgi:hypothetical protein
MVIRRASETLDQRSIRLLESWEFPVSLIEAV